MTAFNVLAPQFTFKPGIHFFVDIFTPKYEYFYA